MRNPLARLFRPRLPERGYHDPSWANAVRRTLTAEAGDDSRPYSSHEAVYRCVSLISRNLAQITLAATWDGKTVKDTAGGEKGALASLLRKPNPLQSRREFLDALLTWWLLDGEVFLLSTDANENPTRPGKMPERLWAVPGRCVEPDENRETKKQIGWKVKLSTGEKAFPLDSVTHLRFFNPYEPTRGLSPLDAARLGYKIDLRAQRFTDALYANGADPGGVLTTDGALTPKQRKEMRQEWEDRHKGDRNAGKVAVLEGGLKYLPVTVNAKDLAYIETRGLSRKQIATVYGVPPYYLAEQGDVSYATARAARRTLWEDAILPIARVVEDALSTKTFATVDTNLGVAFDLASVEALRDDVTTRWEVAERAARMGYPLNVVSDKFDLGMPKVEGGDVGTVAAGLAPLPDVSAGLLSGMGAGDVPAGEGGAPKTNPDAIPQDEKAAGSGKSGAGAGPGTPPPVPAPTGDGGAGKPVAAETAAAGVNPAQTAYNGAQVASLVDVVKAVVAKELPPESAKQILLVAFPLTPDQATAIVGPAETLSEEKPPEPPAPPPVPPAGGGKPPPPPAEPPRVNAPAENRAEPVPGREGRLARWRGIAKVMDQGESRIGLRYRSWLREVYGEIRAFWADRSARAPSRQTWDEWIASRKAAWSDRLVKMLDPVYRKVAADAEAGIKPELGGAFVQAPQGDPALVELIRKKQILVRGVAEKTIGDVRQAVAKGLDAGDDVRGIQERIEERWAVEQRRSLTIARTESAQTVNAVRQETMLRSGVKATTWITAGDAAVREAHVEIDGKTVPIGSSFVDGATLRFPGDLAAPASLVVNCRCSAAPEEIPSPE
jgi:HK97 family phage portal protein